MPPLSRTFKCRKLNTLKTWEMLHLPLSPFLHLYLFGLVALEGSIFDFDQFFYMFNNTKCNRSETIIMIINGILFLYIMHHMTCIEKYIY